ncbi:MAG: spore cortex biosynthesis protein YabQ [Carboxydocellales bacterium]
MVSLSEQFNYFLLTVGTGLLIGLVFDIYWLARHLLNLRKMGTGLGDLIFWSVTTVLAFFLLLAGNWGEVRFYVFMGILLGIGGYIRWLSPITRKVLVNLVRLLAKLLRFTMLIILWPFQLINKLILVPVGYLGMTLYRVIKAGEKLIRQVKAKLRALWRQPRPPGD